MATTPRIRRMQARRNLRDLKSTLSDNYSTNETTRTATAWGRGYVQINGQLYPGSLDGPAGEVINAGRPAAANYVPKTGAGVVVVNGSVSGSGDVGAAGGSINGTVRWRDIDFTGSNITSVQTRRLGDLQGLGEDVLPQYVHKDNARTITAQHTFAPETAKAPFVLGSLALGQLVTGLNSQYVGGQLENVFMRKYANSPLDMNQYQITSNDADIATYLGRIALGGMQFAGHAGFSHRAQVGQGSFALLQNASGDTIINAANTRTLHFRINNQNKLQLSASTFRMFADTDSTVYAGYSAIGHMGHLGYAGFAHQNQATQTGYALLQDGGGHTLLNAATSRSIFLKTGNVNQLSISSGLMNVHSAVAVSTDNYQSQVRGWRLTYSGEADFRYLYVDEMHAKLFIADLEQALAGGQIIAKSVCLLAQVFTAPSPGGAPVILRVRDLPSAPGMAVFQPNDIIRLRIMSRANGSLILSDCWGKVDNFIPAGDGTQAWDFFRSATPNAGSMSAGHQVPVDSIVLDYGTSGNGFHEINAIDGRYGANSPYSQLVTWTDHPATGQVVRVRTGNLTGLNFPGEFGFYTQGSTNSQYLKATNTGLTLRNADVRAYNGSLPTVHISSADGSMKLGADINNPALTTFDFVGTNGAWRLGPVGTNKPNLYWTATEMQLRMNATPVITLDASGNSYFSGVMTIGTSGEIRQGSGSLAANSFTGLRIHRSGEVGLITGYNGSIPQWYASTDGRMYAGGGNVVLSADGIDLQADTTPSDGRKVISWWQNVGTRTGNAQSTIRGFADPVFQAETLELSVRGSQTRNISAIRLLATNNAGTTSYLQMFSTDGISTNTGLAVVPDPQAINATLGLIPGQIRTHWLAMKSTTTPAVVSGHAMMYQDSADNGIKVLFDSGVSYRVFDPLAVGFTSLTLGTGWAFWGAPYHPLMYTRQYNGVIEVRGLVKATTATPATAIAVMPAGSRPPYRLIFACMSINGDGNTAAVRRVDVDTNGEITPTGWTPGLNDWISIHLIYSRGG